MVAVLTEPVTDRTVADPHRPIFIILNAGVVHRPGPGRSSVVLARRVAAAGYAAVRVDTSGIGDGEARRDDRPFAERAVLDVRQLMDHLEKSRGARRFVLAGFACGADNSFATARVDPRVVGGVLIDAFGYPTRRQTIRRYTRRALRPKSWLTLGALVLERGVAWLERRAGLEPLHVTPLPEWTREFPPREEVLAALLDLTKRGTQLYFIYSGDPNYYNYQGQFADMFPELPADVARVDYVADADHTFTEGIFRERLVDGVVAWLTAAFPAAPIPH